MRDYPKNGKVWIVYSQQGGKQQILVMWATLSPQQTSIIYSTLSHWAWMSHRILLNTVSKKVTINPSGLVMKWNPGFIFDLAYFVNNF